MTLDIYLSIGLVLGLARAAHDLGSYLIYWYRQRNIVHFGASLNEFGFDVFIAAIVALLIMWFWPLWLWHKFSEHHRELS